MILAHSHFVDLMFLSFSCDLPNYLIALALDLVKKLLIVDPGAFYNRRGFKTPVASGVYGAVAVRLGNTQATLNCVPEMGKRMKTYVCWLGLMPFFKICDFRWVEVHIYVCGCECGHVLHLCAAFTA